MFLVRKHKNMLVYICFPVFSPFSAHFYPPHYIIMVRGLLSFAATKAFVSNKSRHHKANRHVGCYIAALGLCECIARGYSLLQTRSISPLH